MRAKDPMEHPTAHDVLGCTQVLHITYLENHDIPRVDMQY